MHRFKDDEYRVDVGENLEQLGFAYLFFRFVWPVLIGLIVIGVLFLVLRWFLGFAVAHPIEFVPRSSFQAW